MGNDKGTAGFEPPKTSQQRDKKVDQADTAEFDFKEETLWSLSGGAVDEWN